jgi:hypothetical protein
MKTPMWLVAVSETKPWGNFCLIYTNSWKYVRSHFQGKSWILKLHIILPIAVFYSKPITSTDWLSGFTVLVQ